MGRHIHPTASLFAVVPEMRFIPVASSSVFGDRKPSSARGEIRHLNERMEFAVLEDGTADEPF